MPDASCTGVPPNTTLRACALEIRTAGTYDSCLFSGSVQVMASNVTITRSRVLGRVGDGGTGMQYSASRNLVLVDVEIDGGSLTDPASYAAIGQSGWSCLRCDIHHGGMGVRFGDNVTVRDSWLHDFRQLDSGAHMSGAGSNGGARNVIAHNVIDCPVGACSGALVMYGDFAQVDDVLVTQNLFNSPGSYCLYAGSTGVASGKPFPHGTNIRVVDNVWGRKYNPPQQPGGPSGPRCGIWGPVAAWENNTGNVWSGNAWITGEPILV